MAELGLIGTIIGIASAGVKLSITLYTFSETVSTAPTEIKNIARDVSLTSSVLEELGANLKQDEQARLYSGSAVQTAKDVVGECEGVFKEIDAVVAKAMDSTSKKGLKRGGKLTLSALERLKWPFLQPKMELLRGNLERLKSTLVLMLNVLTYARDLRAEKKSAPKEEDNYQRVLLENLVRANQEASQNYQTLLRTIGPKAEVVEAGRSLDTEATATTDSTVVSPVVALMGGAGPPPYGATASELGMQSSAKLESTIQGCLRKIENALLQFEGSSSQPTNTDPRISVRVELEKENTAVTHGRPKPWVLLSIVRKEQAQSTGGRQMIQIGAAPASTTGTDASGPSSRTAALQAEVDAAVGIMTANINQVSQRGERLDSLHDRTDNLGGPSEYDPVAYENWRKARRPRRQSWYSSVWNSMPSPTAAMSSIQRTVKNAGLFMGVDEETDDPDTVLAYGDSHISQSGAKPNSPSIPTSPTFDDILQGGEARTTFRVKHSVNTTDAAASSGTTTLHAPTPLSPKRQGVAQHLAATDPGDSRWSAEAEHESSAQPAEPKPEDAPLEPDNATEAAADSQQVSTDDLVDPASESPSQMYLPADQETVAVDGKDEIPEGTPAPDAVDLLLKEWTTLYE